MTKCKHNLTQNTTIAQKKMKTMLNGVAFLKKTKKDVNAYQKNLLLTFHAHNKYGLSRKGSRLPPCEIGFTRVLKPGSEGFEFI